MEKDFKSNFCAKLRSRSNSQAHIVSQHEGPRYRQKRFTCNVCQYKVPGESALIVHMRKHTGERPFKCTVDGCGKEFKVRKTLKEHMSYKHSDERPFKCTFPGCRCTTKTYTDLFAHKRVHSEDRPFACPKAGCNYRAKTRSNVRVHAQNVHSGAKPFACSQCDYRSAQKSAVKSHMIRRHSARRDFKCSHPQCTKSFKTSWDLKDHFSTRHQERNIQCDHPGCEGTFPTRRALNNHKQGVHSMKSIACPNVSCKFRTSKTAALALHMITHDRRNEKIPCLTEGCEFKGKNSLDMQSHMRHHKTRLVCPILGCSQNTFTEQALKDHMKLHNPVGRPSQCPLCNKHFPNSNQLHSHVFAHTNEKPLKCGHCEYSTSARGVLRRHISSVHAKLKFHFVVHPLDRRECLGCNVELPIAEFIVHSMGHTVPVIKIERLDLNLS